MGASRSEKTAGNAGSNVAPAKQARPGFLQGLFLFFNSPPQSIPMSVSSSLRTQLAAALRDHTLLPDKEILRLFETPPEGFGELSLPCFHLAKNLKKAPAQIAQELSTRPYPPFVKKVAAAGPYLNFFFDFPSLAPEILAEAEKPLSLPQQPARYMVEVFHANTHLSSF